MQRRLRIALAVTAAAGAALLGTGTAYADVVTDIIGGGADTTQVSPTDESGDYTADEGDGDSTDADDSGDDDSSSDDSGSDS